MSKIWKFPAGEIGLNYEPTAGEEVEFFIRNGSSDEILRLLLEVDAASRLRDMRPFVLNMPYVPYGRQDRVTDQGTSFSLEVFSKLINQQVFEKVRIFDPHSHVTWEKIERPVIYSACDIMQWFPIGLLPVPVKDMVVIAPDKGAWVRAGQCCTALGAKACLTATKHRNPTTGRIEGIHLDGDLNSNDHVLIIDDICDGGGTFLALNDAIGGKCKSISLYVSHGIFSKGYKAVADHFHTVVTTDSFVPPEHAGYNMADRPPASHIITLNHIIPNWT